MISPIKRMAVPAAIAGWAAAVEAAAAQSAPNPADIEKAASLASSRSMYVLLIMGIVFAVIFIASLVFWIMMIVHAASKPVQNKALWIIVMLFTGVIGALIYYFVVKRPMDHPSVQV